MKWTANKSGEGRPPERAAVFMIDLYEPATRPREQPYVASIPVRVSASAVTTAVGPLAGTLVQLPRLVVTAARDALTSLSATMARPSAPVARQLSGTASWLWAGGWWRVPGSLRKRV